MTFARFTLALFVSLSVTAVAASQTQDSAAIIRGKIDYLQKQNFGEPSWSAPEVARAAMESGLSGQWTVTSSIKDGEFSKAQIGQEPGDIISIGPTELALRSISEVQVS